MKRVKTDTIYNVASSIYNTVEEYLAHAIDEWERVKSCCNVEMKRKILKEYLQNASKIREYFPNHRVFPEADSIKISRETFI